MRKALRLYLVAGLGDCGKRPLADVVAAAVRGGASMVQLRHKDAGIRELVDSAKGLAALLKPLGIPLIINDRVDAALAAGAAGVHLGQTDMDPRDARRILGPGAIIGWTVKTPEQARAARDMGVDYVGMGPAYATSTKTDAGAVLGPRGLADLAACTDLPIVAIGGIGPGNAAPLIRSGGRAGRGGGVCGVAVVSAVCAAQDPEAVARALRAEVELVLL